MKTMGLSRLFLVKPKTFPDPKAAEMSSHAEDILEHAVVATSLEEALQGCALAVGTSARPRSIALQTFNPRTCAEYIKQTISQMPHTEIALVFGREQTGLTNEELMLCQYQVHIPTNPDYNSLNLASAVQVLAYELRMALLAHTLPNIPTVETEEKATIGEVEQFYEHLETVLADLGFLRKENPTLMPKLRRLFHRIHLEKSEVNILRGILTSVQKTKFPEYQN